MHIASVAGDATIALAVQAALKKLLAGKGFHAREATWMDEEEMVEHARHRLALRYHVPYRELQVLEQSVTREGSGCVMFAGPAGCRYEVKLQLARSAPTVTEFHRTHTRD
jgi:hypothetical protein